MLTRVDKAHIGAEIGKQMSYLIEQLDELLDQNVFERIVFSPGAGQDDDAEIILEAREQFAKQLIAFIQEGP